MTGTTTGATMTDTRPLATSELPTTPLATVPIAPVETTPAHPIPSPHSPTEPAKPGEPSAPRPLRTLRARSLPARWRITAWILLSTLFTLVAVGLIGRSLSLAAVEVDANAAVEQEAAEFSRFVSSGVDPETAAPFASVERLLAVYLERQSANPGETIAGLAGNGPSAELISAGTVSSATPESPAVTEPASDSEVLREISSSAASSGTFPDSEDGPVRWGKVSFTLGEEQGALVITQHTAAARAAVDRALGTLAWVAALGLVLCSGVAWLVAGQILAPVREVYRVARNIGEHDLTARVPVSGSDDVAAVAVTFNEMLDRLEEVHRTQQRFVDDAGHELRTPITVVRGHLELLSEDPAERQATLRLVTDELGRMSRIVSDLLVLARAQQPDFVTLAPHDAASLTLDIEAKAQALGARRWQLMEVAEGEVELDAQRVTQAMLQLAANAVQVTDPGDRIRVGSRFTGEGAERHLRLWVADTGPGVAPADAERIFERFVHGGITASPRSDTTGPAPRHGSGLGLAIVRAIADGHAGSAWLESTPGMGATFGLDLPAPHTLEKPHAAHSDR